MKFEKAFVVCPECKKKTYAYLVDYRELTEEITDYFVSIANFCGYCGCDLRPMHKQCEECGFVDWEDVFTGECPYCQIKGKLFEKAEEGEL